MSTAGRNAPIGGMMSLSGTGHGQESVATIHVAVAGAGPDILGGVCFL